MATSSTRSTQREVNEQRVVEEIISVGPVSRAELSQRLRLSKPTVSSIVADLETERLVHATGHTSGSVGRSAVLYELNGTAGYIVGLDLGGTNTRVAVADLFGTIVAERTVPTADRHDTEQTADDVIDGLADVSRDAAAEVGIDWSRVHSVAVGVPGVVAIENGRVRFSPNVAALEGADVGASLQQRLATRVAVDNDANMGALGEQWHGAGTGRETFGFIAFGTGVGMGLVLRGAVYRGATGGGGEIALLPLGHRDPFDPAHRRHGPFEDAVAGAAVGARLREATAQGLSTRLGADAPTEAVVAAAEDGDEAAEQVLSGIAEDLALAVSATTALLDLEVVVLGGGVGANPALRRRLDESLSRLPARVPVTVSHLGERAPLVGAVTAALRGAREQLLGAAYG